MGHLVNPLAADRHPLGRRRKGRRDEGERGAQQHGSAPQRDHPRRLDCLADDAVQYEPVFQPKFPASSEFSRESFKKALFGAILCVQNARIIKALAANSLLEKNREFLPPSREFSRASREFRTAEQRTANQLALRPGGSRMSLVLWLERRRKISSGR
jgi:hypothetical protein